MEAKAEIAMVQAIEPAAAEAATPQMEPMGVMEKRQTLAAEEEEAVGAEKHLKSISIRRLMVMVAAAEAEVLRVMVYMAHKVDVAPSRNSKMENAAKRAYA